jgi:hypothetical protein
MTSPLAKSLLEQQGDPCFIVPCTVTQVTPLLITLLGQTNVPAVKVIGATYTLNAAVAVVTKAGQPIVLPTVA